MTLQLLVAAMHQDPEELPRVMGIQTDALIVNQCGTYGYRELDIGHRIDWYDCDEVGVGRSRNTALLRADADIVLFSDEDIRYDEGYADRVVTAFRAHPDADVLFFNIEVCEERRTYWTERKTRVRRHSCGRYPTYSAACRLSSLRRANVWFSLLFGGGAPYSNGEDSLFFMSCLRAGLRLYALPIRIGYEEARESTWFHGYDDRFFIDRGVLFAHLYGRLAWAWALRYAIVKRRPMGWPISSRAAYALMRDGIRIGRGGAAGEKTRRPGQGTLAAKSAGQADGRQQA